MNQLTGPTPADTAPRVISDAEYDYQFWLYDHMTRAAADPIHRLALLEAFAISGDQAAIPSLVRAIDYLQDHDDAGDLVAA